MVKKIINLKDGRPLEIRVFQAPAEEISEMILSFLAHKGKDWLLDIETRLKGSMLKSRDYFILGFLKDMPVSHLWLTVSAEDPILGIIGHVYTHPAFRKKGISGEILKHAHELLFDPGGKIILLQTRNPEAFAYYEKRGYKRISGEPEKGEVAVMYYEKKYGELNQLLKEEGKVKRAEIRPLNSGDLPNLFLLYSIAPDDGILIRNRAQGIMQGFEIELKFLNLFSGPNIDFYLNKIETGNHLIRAIATVIRRPIPIERVLDLDFYFLPGYQESSKRVLEEIFAERLFFSQVPRPPHDLVLEYQGADNQKVEILKSFGFKLFRKEDGYYSWKGKSYDLMILRKGWDHISPVKHY